MKYQNFNFHTHTYRCGHAKKTEDDYIKVAIQRGFEAIGFSEHCGYEGFDNPRERIAFKDMDKYLLDINKAKEKYKDKIKVYAGLEIEYFDDLKNYYFELKEKYDYLIIGQHLRDRKGYDYTYTCNDKDIRYMADKICTALELGISKYVAHPDYPMLARDNFSKDFEMAIRQIVQCANKNNALVELNLKGMSYGIHDYKTYLSYIYPHNNTLDIYEEENASVVIGYDAHLPEFLNKTYLEETAKNLKNNLNFIDDYKVILFSNEK